MLIKDIADFKLLIIPIFYLLHGEPFDSDMADDDASESYYLNITPQFINIMCKKCEVSTFNTLRLEF